MRAGGLGLLPHFLDLIGPSSSVASAFFLLLASVSTLSLPPLQASTQPVLPLPLTPHHCSLQTLGSSGLCLPWSNRLLFTPSPTSILVSPNPPSLQDLFCIFNLKSCRQPVARGPLMAREVRKAGDRRSKVVASPPACAHLARVWAVHTSHLEPVHPHRLAHHGAT